MAEGSIEADIFYITPEDSRPMYAMKASVPFQQLIEVHDITPDTVYTIKKYTSGTGRWKINLPLLDYAQIREGRYMSQAYYSLDQNLL